MHTKVQEALASGKPGPLILYIEAVHQQLSLEHRQWLADSEAMGGAVNELKASLDVLDSDYEKPPPAA